MKRFMTLLLCLTIPVAFMIGCGKKQEAEKKAEQQVEEVQKEAAVDTTAAAKDTSAVQE